MSGGAWDAWFPADDVKAQMMDTADQTQTRLPLIVTFRAPARTRTDF